MPELLQITNTVGCRAFPACLQPSSCWQVQSLNHEISHKKAWTLASVAFGFKENNLNKAGQQWLHGC